MEKMGETIILGALVGDSNIGNVWGKEVETAKAVRGGVGVNIEEIGDRWTEGEILKFLAKSKTEGGTADGLIHCDDKIWNGTLTTIDDAQTAS